MGDDEYEREEGVMKYETRVTSGFDKLSEEQVQESFGWLKSSKVNISRVTTTRSTWRAIVAF
jgi:hypothetical protein